MKRNVDIQIYTYCFFKEASFSHYQHIVVVKEADRMGVGLLITVGFLLILLLIGLVFTYAFSIAVKKEDAVTIDPIPTLLEKEMKENKE